MNHPSNHSARNGRVRPRAIARREFLSLPAAALLPSRAGAADSPRVRLKSTRAGRKPAALEQQWAAVLTHTHNWRWPGDKALAPYDETERELAAWCVRLGIRAMGVGSPWNPQQLASYVRYEGPDRDLYYSGQLDPQKLMDRESVAATLATLNAYSGGRTLFYLDNETPKASTGHAWWFGYNYDVPAWHDYTQDRLVKRYGSDPEVEINKLTGEPHTRRDLFEIMAIQHQAGALGVFAHPTRWWLDGSDYITNVAALAPLFLAVYGRLDGLTVMGDRPYNAQYQKLWFSFLDTGAWVGGFAETDFLLNFAARKSAAETFLNFMPAGENVTEPAIVAAARRGEVFASNGPFVTLRVDGQAMGSVVRTQPGKAHRIAIEAYPAPGQSALGRIELVGKGGAVVFRKDAFPGGTIECELDGASGAGYLVARVFGQGDDPNGAVRFHAVTNPVYLQPAGFRLGTASTSFRIRVARDSRWVGGEIEFQTPAGSLILRHPVTAGTIEDSVPADARMVVRTTGMRALSFFIATENPEVEKLIQPLVHGEFRREHPGLKGSEVPVQAFRLPELREAVKRFEYAL